MQYLVGLLPLLATAVFASPIAKRADNQLIQSSVSGRCLSPASGAQGVASGAIGIETNVVTIDCSTAADWNIRPGSGSVILSGTDYALEAAGATGEKGGLVLYDSCPGAKQQTWYLTHDDRIAITGGNRCLTESETGPYYAPCKNGDKNQAWKVYQKASSPSASAAPSAAAPSACPSSSHK